MTALAFSWRSHRRTWFVLVAVFVNAALTLWFLLPDASTSPPAQEPPPEPRQAVEKPISLKERLQATLAKETLEQSIEHLTDFDDTVWCMGCLGNDAVNYTHYTYAHAIIYYPGLNRVRKILEEGHENPGRVVPILKDKLAHAMDGYKQLVVEFGKEIRSHDPIINTRWSEFDKRAIYTSVSVYLLAQFGAYDALPSMASLFTAEGDLAGFFKGEPQPINDIQQNGILVNRLFLFYAMHHLARNHPRERLSSTAVKKLDDYLEASKEIPAYEEVLVPSSRADFEAWDYRISILGKDVGMDKQPHIRVYEFPQNRPYLESFIEAVPAPQVMQWFAKMRSFIEEAYPNAVPPAPKAKGAPK